MAPFGELGRLGVLGLLGTLVPMTVPPARRVIPNNALPIPEELPGRTFPEAGCCPGRMGLAEMKIRTIQVSVGLQINRVSIGKWRECLGICSLPSTLLYLPICPWAPFLAAACFCLIDSLIRSTSFWYRARSLCWPSFASLSACSNDFTRSWVARRRFSSLGSSHLRSALSLTSCKKQINIRI